MHDNLLKDGIHPQIFHLRFSHFGLNNETQWDLACEPAFGLFRYPSMAGFWRIAGARQPHRLVTDMDEFV